MFSEIRRIFNGLRNGFRFGRRSRAMILHPSRQRYGFDPRWHSPQNHRNSVEQGSDNMLADSADQMFAPHQHSEDHFEYRPIDQGGNALHESEEWRRENNSMQVTRTKRRVVTCSQAVVEPHQICGRCSESGCGFTHELYRCVRCGRGYCHHHAFITSRLDGPGILILCRDHLLAENEVHNVWDAIDRANGRIPQPAIFPERPYSVGILSQSSGGAR